MTGPRLKAELRVAIQTSGKPRMIDICFECENDPAIFKQMFMGAMMYRAGDEGVILTQDFFSEQLLERMWLMLIRKLEEEEVERLLREASQSDL